MGKDDIEVPPRPPAKRRQLEAALPQWLATWANDESLTPSERRRVQAERDRRKKMKVRSELVVGLVLAEEGVTPAQLDALRDTVRSTQAAQVVHTRIPRKVHGKLAQVCREQDVPLVLRAGDGLLGAREVVRESDIIIAAPREPQVQTYATPGVWSMVGLARHRSTPVSVVLPDGQVLQGDQLHG